MPELIATGATYNVGRIALNQSFSGTAVFSAVTALSIKSDTGFVHPTYGFAFGESVNASGAAGAFAIGSSTIASGLYSFAGGSASRAQASYAFAYGNTAFATSTGAFAIGLTTNATGNYAFAAGRSTTASGIASTASGSGTTASGASSVAEGVLATANHTAEFARSSNGVGQFGIVHFAAQTTNATPTVAYINGTSERFSIYTDKAYYVRMTAIARNTGTGDSATWKGEGLIKNVSGTVSLVGTFVMDSISQDAVFSTAGITMSADNTNKSLMIILTGTASGSDNVNWFLTAQYDRAN